MKKQYETSDFIKKEFVDFLKWYKPEENSEQIFENYCKDKDIAFSGDLRKIHQVSKRNAKKELVFVLCAATIGIVLGVIGGIWLSNIL